MNKSHTHYLHLFVIVSFAVAQPIYDLLGKYPEFFVAHSAKSSLIIYMIVFLSIGLALILVSVEIIARLFSERTRCGIHWLFIFVFAALIAVPLLKRIIDSDFLIVGFGVMFGIFFTFSYARYQVVNMFVTVLSPVILIFPLWFVLTSPVGRLVIPSSDDVKTEIQINNPITTIVLVFDEFSTTALLDDEGRIDRVRFPNFAKLAEESWWFPNAISVSQSTVEAIPSIVTGMNPKPSAKLMATDTDYPNNLFTILGGQYILDVFETSTALCPENLCAQQNKMKAYNYASFLSDVIVIYANLITPSGSLKILPTLEARWAGFGEKIVDNLPVVKNLDNSNDLSKKRTNKKAQLAQFLSIIRESATPKLYFIHTELPHVPYCYLASGQRYSDEQKLPDGIISDKVGWLGDKSLILTAYNRYLQQVGYVDNFLGNLKKQLISEGIYNNSLLILTADHGVAFEPWQSRRIMSGTNNNEILKIPMFVKLPEQKLGRIDERIVSSVDVLPTIMDVLDVNDPWISDGLSMITEQVPNREGFDFVGIGYLSKDEIVGFSRLQWQIEYFGEHTGLDKLIPKGPFYELVKRDLTIMHIGEKTNMSLKSESIESLKNIDIDSPFLPMLIKGYIEGTDKKNLPLAIAVNSKIMATTYSSEWDEKNNFFSVLLPIVALRHGKNTLSVYLIEKTRDKFSLRPINEDKKDVKLRRTHDDKLTVVFVDGKEVSVETNRKNINGYLDWLTLSDDMFIFDGWAADLVEGEPASDILIFRNEKLLWRVEPDFKREGVVKTFNRPTLLRSGYRARVPLRILESHSGDINVIALSKDKRAFRIHINDEYKKLIRKTLPE